MYQCWHNYFNTLLTSHNTSRLKLAWCEHIGNIALLLAFSKQSSTYYVCYRSVRALCNMLGNWTLSRGWPWACLNTQTFFVCGRREFEIVTDVAKLCGLDNLDINVPIVISPTVVVFLCTSVVKLFWRIRFSSNSPSANLLHIIIKFKSHVRTVIIFIKFYLQFHMSSRRLYPAFTAAPRGPAHIRANRGK
jgi:hypothetical protein